MDFTITGKAEYITLTVVAGNPPLEQLLAYKSFSVERVGDEWSISIPCRNIDEAVEIYKELTCNA